VFDTKAFFFSQLGEPLVDAAFGILGRTALRIDGTLDENWGAPRERAVLATLLINPGRSVPINTLIDWVWPQDVAPPRNRVPTFHTYATRIRRSLQRADTQVNLVAQDGSYRLEVDRTGIDYYRFGSLMAQVRSAQRQGQSPDVLPLALEAIDLWRGRPLDDLASEPAAAWRRRVLQDEWVPANIILLEALLEMDEFGEVLTRLNDLQVDHEHDVTLAKLRMSALHGLSRTSEVTSYYFSVRRRLLSEADEQAAEHLRQHHEGLRGTDQGSAPNVAPVPRQLPHDMADFVGRVDLLRALDIATTRPTHESGGVVILDGMAGVGKTALAVHWGHLARHRFPDGELFVNLNGFSDGVMVPQSRVVDDFLIALGHPPDSSVSQPPDSSVSQRARELQLSRLLANRRMLVVLDNARNTSHIKDLIGLLPSCVVIVTSRQRLTTLSAATGARRVRVEPMRDDEASELLAARVGDHLQIADDDRAHLIQLCGGLPLVITMLADHIASSGATLRPTFAQQLDRRQLIVDVGEDGDGSAIAHTFFSWSYQRLDPPEQRLFRLLGLHPGPDIGIDVAGACDGRTPLETKRSFGALVGAHLLERPVVFDRY
jgi:DNA-binding SARP family transcriptional activator